MDAADRYWIEPLDTQDRRNFCCGNDLLDRYIREIATQDIKRRMASCLVATIDGQIAGYMTLSMTGVELCDIPKNMAKGLPRYSTIPAVLVGRLAVDRPHQGCGVASLLLFRAMQIASSNPVACYAVVTDPIDDRARAFYERLSFVQLQSSRQMFPLNLFRSGV